MNNWNITESQRLIVMSENKINFIWIVAFMIIAVSFVSMSIYHTLYGINNESIMLIKTFLGCIILGSSATTVVLSILR